MENWSKKRKFIIIISCLTVFVATVFLFQFDGGKTRLEVCQESYTAECYDIMLPPEEYKRKIAKEWKEKTGRGMGTF